MAHFYKYNGGFPVFLEDATTPAQAKKVHGAFPSVTTVLGVIKDPFLDSIYKPRKICEIARERPELYWREVADLTYGVRDHPITGDEMPSSEFGTEVHKCIEEHVNADLLSKELSGKSVWDDWAEPFIEWYKKEGVTPVAVEHMIGENTIKIVGSVDFIGKDRAGEVFLADYKCRSNCKGKGKFYDKDCQQLAIEAWMLMRRTKLDYIPGCISVCIDCDTTEHYHKVWNPEEILHGIEVAKLCAKLYWKTRMQTKKSKKK